MLGRLTEKLESFIGVNCIFEGQIETKGTIRIDGAINGNVNADCIILGENAQIKGDLNARSIIIGGKITGNINAKEIVEIKQKGKVYGEITSVKMSIAEGGIFEGTSRMQKAESIVVELQSKEKAKF